MSNERVQEIEQLRREISEAPWVLDHAAGPSHVYCDDGTGSCVARCRPPRNVPSFLTVPECDRNAAFIAAAPEAVDDLLAEVRRLQSRLAEVEQDTKRLDFLAQNPFGLRAIDGNSCCCEPFDVRDLIDAAMPSTTPEGR